MTHKFDPAQRRELDSPERLFEMPPEETLLKAGIRPGDIIADIGCGTGYFSVPASKMIGPRGHVYAIDISGVMLADIRSRIAAAGIFNIETTQTLHGKLSMPEVPVTFALISDTLHEVDDKKAFLASVSEALKPGARLSVIEWAHKETGKGPPLEDRISGDEMRVLLKNAGFTEPAASPLGTGHVLYTCLKKAA